MDLNFSQRFDVSEETLDAYGAFDINLASDLPLFIDPFLLFNSDDPEYQKLHEGIIKYLKFLRDNADGHLSKSVINNWYRFREVKQNWLGFTLLGNSGQGLGQEFAEALHSALGDILAGFGNESITSSSHLEKLALIRDHVGRDGISDFTTNLIKGYLLEYTQTFANTHLDAKSCAWFNVPRAYFNYQTESWVTSKYFLPKVEDDFVLLTPIDILTQDDTWISRRDMIRNFSQIPAALPDDQLRGQVDHYFNLRLGTKPSQADRDAAAVATIREFPDLIDYYIKLREDSGDQAEAISAQKVKDIQDALVKQLQSVIPDIEARSTFYDKPWTSYDECLDRVMEFKNYVENNDGYKLINRKGEAFSKESEVQLFFGLIWCNSDFDVNREPNNGRGPVDFKVSYGSKDKSLIEFKLGSSTSLKRNLEKQVEIYEKANKTWTSVKVIVYYTAKDEERVNRILKELGIEDSPAVVKIDARSDNKPSASKA